MSEYLEAWRSGAVLEGPRLMALARQFSLACMGRCLEQLGWPEERVERLEQQALQKYLLPDGGLRRNFESPTVSHEGLTVTVKSFLGDNYSAFERMLLATGDSVWRAVIYITFAEEEPDGQERRFRIGSVFAGVWYWMAGREPTDVGQRMQAYLQEVWQGMEVKSARCRPRDNDGNGMIGIDWTMPEEVWTEDALVDRIGELLAAAAVAIRKYDAEQPTTPPRPTGGKGADGDLATRLADHLQQQGYRFTAEQVATFYGGLKTKGFVILAGLSGTGKTKIAQQFATALGLDDGCFLLEPVRPDWRDGTGLLGYWNPVTPAYEAPRFLRFVLAAEAEFRARGADARPYIAVLDEMNLARVEYYLADLLSVLETGVVEEGPDAGFTPGLVTLHDRPAPVMVSGNLKVAPQLRLPPNLYLVGTVNMDETTFAFSPKVLDRAFTLEFRDVDLSGYPPMMPDPVDAGAGLAESEVAAVLRDLARSGQFARLTKPQVAAWGANRRPLLAALHDLNVRLTEYDLHFGYRVADEVLGFVGGLAESPFAESLPEDAAFDAAVMMKVLPKFHGPLHRLEGPLQAVLGWAAGAGAGSFAEMPGSGLAGSSGTELRYPRTYAKASRMLRTARELGHAAF